MAYYDLLILALAVLIDQLLGEMPSAVHPVVWMGKAIALADSRAPKSGKAVQLVHGVVIVIAVAALFAIPAYYLLNWLGQVSLPAQVAVGALVLKSTFSVRELRLSANRVKGLLSENRTGEARSRMRALVSRDVGDLDEKRLLSATVESVSENVCDSLVAPLFYFLLLGVPGAVAYRVVNTFDAMIGYHGDYEHLGKFAARLDDVLNYVPARISGLLIVVGAFLSRRNGPGSWRVMLRDHGKTSSPNAGWGMAAAAGALDLQLEKVDFYRLGDPVREVSFQAVDSMAVLLNVAAGLWTGLCLLVKAVPLVSG